MAAATKFVTAQSTAWYPREQPRGAGGMELFAERIRSMVGYMNLEEQVDRDFRLALRKALLGSVGAHLRREAAPNRLLCFVLDGHHRVSVARYQGVEWIDAEVTEFRVVVPEVRRGGVDTMSHEKRGSGGAG